MTKLSLSAAVAATFAATAYVPIPGKDPAPVKFDFKYRDSDEFKEYAAKLKDWTKVEAIVEAAEGWDLDEPFNKESVEKLLKKYMGAGDAILRAYVDELSGARVKNW